MPSVARADSFHSHLQVSASAPLNSFDEDMTYLGFGFSTPNQGKSLRHSSLPYQPCLSPSRAIRIGGLHLRISPLAAGLGPLPTPHRVENRAPSCCTAQQCLAAVVELLVGFRRMVQLQIDSHCMAASVVVVVVVVVAAAEDSHCLTVAEGIPERKRFDVDPADHLCSTMTT